MKLKNRKLVIWGAMSALALSVLTVGCERTISQTESTKVKSDGTVESKEKKSLRIPMARSPRQKEKQPTSPNLVSKANQ
jgi:hypothetical protein